MDTAYMGEKIRLQCNKEYAVLAGVRFRYLDLIEITVRKDTDLSEGQGSGGPWGWGGYSAAYIKSISSEIKDLQSGLIIWAH